MTLRNVSLLSARLLAMFLIVTALVGLPADVDAIFNHQGFLIHADSLLRLIGGVIVWISARPFAISAELSGMDLDDQLAGRDETEQSETEQSETGNDEVADVSAIPASTFMGGRDVLIVGAVLMGLYILVGAIPSFASRVYSLVDLRTIHDPAARSTLLRGAAASVIVGAIQILIGAILVAGRERVADVVERFRYRQTSPAADENVGE